MMPPEKILDRLLLVGGPPRSGTTFIARALNAHPRIVTAVDDHVHECWALYHYPTRRGLVHDLRHGCLERTEAVVRLRDHLFAGGHFAGVAPSAQTEGSPLAGPPEPPALAAPGSRTAVRHALALERFAADWYLCLKSPEISFVLPRLTELLPQARFVLVFRPVSEIAESMFRKGLTVRKIPVFQRRWEGERLDDGRLIPPPGVPEKWQTLWGEVTAFQRCVIYAASYLQAVIGGCAALSSERYFIYDHARLRARSEPILRGLASFLGVDDSGFRAAAAGIRSEVPALTGELSEEYERMRNKLELEALVLEASALAERALARFTRKGCRQ